MMCAEELKLNNVSVVLLNISRLTISLVFSDNGIIAKTEVANKTKSSTIKNKSR